MPPTPDRRANSPSPSFSILTPASYNLSRSLITKRIQMSSTRILACERALLRHLTPRSLPAASSSFSTSSLVSVPALPTSATPIFFDRVNLSSPSGEQFARIPAFRALDGEGKVLEELQGEWLEKLQAIPRETLVKMYKHMMFLPALDVILSSSQRQGRISFYMTSMGEEGAVVGSAAAWDERDEVFAQYREVGVLLWRGYPMSSLMAQVFSSKNDDATLGRQMPIHYGSAEHHFHTISSPLATQIPQAAGAAYALKRTPGRENSCVICYMGEGASSEGDFHAGLNMASVLGGPVVFFVRVSANLLSLLFILVADLKQNNGFAISTPSSEQYHGDGIASRGPGYGIETIRIDGNDPTSVYLACSEARRKAVEGQKPILVEAMSYRVGHHSTSDDSSAYRSAAAVESIKKLDSPLFRMRRYLESLPEPAWSQELEDVTKAEHKKLILSTFSVAEKDKKPALDAMWGGVWAGEGDEMERPIREQRKELKRLVKKWGETKVWKKELSKFDGGKDKFLSD